MRFADKFRYILRPFSVSAAVVVLVVLFFISAYAFLEHHWHLSAYRTTQQNELKAFHHKVATTIKDLKDLSKLTEARILASKGDLKRIQNILISVYRLLPNYSFPKIQKVSYAKLSMPQMVVTRVGMSPLSPPVSDTLEKGSSLIFGDNTIISKSFVRNEKGKLEGVFDIQIELAEFKDSLGRYETISLSPFSSLEEEHFVLQQEPFDVYAKAPANFWEFVSINILRYLSMLSICLFCIIFVNVRFYFFYRRLQNTYETKLKGLEVQYLKASEKLDLLTKDLSVSQKNLECHQISVEAYRAFYTRVMHRKSEHIHYILRSLEIVKQALQNPTNPLPEAERIEIVDSCRDTGRLLSKGLIAKVKTEPIKLKHLLDGILLLFAERVHRFNITLTINCHKDLIFYGDPLLTEFVLATLIGKPIHRVPKNGKVSIVIRTQNDSLCCDVEDNGYFLLEDKEEFIKKSFDLFMLKDAFHQVCQENGFVYEHSKTDNGNNVSKIIFSSPSQDISVRNVIPLFK